MMADVRCDLENSQCGASVPLASAVAYFEPRGQVAVGNR